MDLSTLMPQQLQIVKTLDRPLFVSAGAGSGKTFTLTRRIVYALSPESGPFVEHLDQVLAITFTKDAAAEIRDRVRRALIEEGMDEEALTVDDAWISTIHGMCSRILRAHALELGIDPEFTVLTDTDELMDQAVEHVLGRATAPMPRLSSPPRLRPSTLGIPWRARAGRLAPVPPSKAGARPAGAIEPAAGRHGRCVRGARPGRYLGTRRRYRARWVRARPRPRKRRCTRCHRAFEA